MHQSKVNLSFIPMTPDHIEEIEEWFDDPETQRFLGGREWIRRLPALLRDSPGVEFRGRRVLARHAWVVHTAGSSVAIVDVESYDDGTAGIALAVAPAMRRKGIGKQVLSDLKTLSELAGVNAFIWAVEPENKAARHCMSGARFEVSEREDEEGMLRISRRLA